MRVVSTEKTIEDVTGWSEERRLLLKFTRTEEVDGVKKVYAVYPKGTEVYGAQAEQLLRLGKAKEIE